MNSTSHRANILSRNVTEMGAAVTGNGSAGWYYCLLMGST